MVAQAYVYSWNNESELKIPLSGHLVLFQSAVGRYIHALTRTVLSREEHRSIVHYLGLATAEKQARQVSINTSHYKVLT
jgi:hypothetical protein